MNSTKRPPGGAKPGQERPKSQDLYQPGDPIPVPEVVDQDSEACWSLWNELSQFGESSLPQESAWSPTKPAGLDAAAAGRPPSGSADGLTVEKVLNLARQNNRVCPRPGQWMELYDLITGGAKPGAKGQPPEPITGRAWERTSAIQKRLCLRDQLFWADMYCSLALVHGFLARLGEDEWHHVGE